MDKIQKERFYNTVDKIRNERWLFIMGLYESCGIMKLFQLNLIDDSIQWKYNPKITEVYIKRGIR